MCVCVLPQDWSQWSVRVCVTQGDRLMHWDMQKGWSDSFRLQLQKDWRNSAKSQIYIFSLTTCLSYFICIPPHLSLSLSSTHLKGPSAFLPPLPAVLRQQTSSQAALNNNVPDTGATWKPRNEERAAEAERHGRSWTVSGKQCTAQWIRQKHEFRSTRPWWCVHKMKSWMKIREEKGTWAHKGRGWWGVSV